ncbi:hypothetical protein NQ036_06725 [Brevibacterium sp. 91QC2O2]|uniref:hypothetical protein n=1 Tax=Brevibacterium sp. 91QC2O2 TaxID=2968458 RepID=UPI00211B8164|nr:hypothetical protein [Brevibacterium sp. 91QC2O2]MCQ9367937.1 hypothetical protein [Brevibacterium sp. 91QC2O2]
MAQYNITEYVTDNLTIDDLRKSPFWCDIADLAEGVFIRSRSSYEKFLRWAADRTPAQPEAVAQEMDKQAGPKATEKQVAFILRLIADDRHEGCHMVIPTDYDVIASLPRRTASTYIDAMLNN